MVRKCAVKDCEETDMTILSHRFPKNLEFAKTWAAALNLTEIEIEDLLKKYVVCTRHFKNANYRNGISSHLNSTSIPNLENNSCNNRINSTTKSLPKITMKPDQLSKILQNASSKQIVKLKRISNETESETLQKRSKLELTPVKTPESTLHQEIQSNQINSPERNSTRETSEMENQFYIVNISENTQEMIETTNEINLLQTEIILKNQESQTEQESPETHTIGIQTERQQNESDNESRYIQVMYPEYFDASKTELIEKILEYQKSIELLENKNEKFQNVIKDLLKN